VVKKRMTMTAEIPGIFPVLKSLRKKKPRFSPGFLKNLLRFNLITG
jgi:hypothetical protein